MYVWKGVVVVVDKTLIVEVLKKHPKGLKAKNIATYISGADRKSINQILYAHPQMFVCNDCFEWSLATQTPSPNRLVTTTKDEIKNLFINEYIDNDTYELLKFKSMDELKKYKARYVELSEAINTSHSFYFGTIIQKAILVSDDQFNLVLNRTKQLREIYKTRKYEEWELVIFAPNFDELCSNIKTLQEYAVLKNLSSDYFKSDDWMKIISKRLDRFKEFLNRIELLTNIEKPIYESELISISLNAKFKSWENRIKK